MITLRDDWEFNVVGVYNYRKPGTLRHYMDYIAEHHQHIEGDICEAGVYEGRSLLATGLLLKELGSSKQIFGYDTFQGFPAIYHENDEMGGFNRLLQSGGISKEHYQKAGRNLAFRLFHLRTRVLVQNISSSADFSGAKIEDLQRKIKYLGLDNIHLVVGPFAETMAANQAKTHKYMAALLDCDLYMSYNRALPFVWERLVLGGYVYLDEYYSLKFPGARIATDEFFATKRDKPHKHKDEPGDFERWGVRKLHEEEP